MIKLNGFESSVLAFLAQRPEYFERFKNDLGPEALAIAEYLAGFAPNPVPDVKLTGNAILQWALERLK